MSDDWRNKLATEQQMEKLRFFGCTWDEGITARQASDALEECARQFPDEEAVWQLQKRKLSESSGTFPVEAFVKLDEAVSGEATIQKAETVASEPVATAPAFVPPTPEQIAELRAFGQVPPAGLTFAEAKIWIEQCKILYPAKSQNENPQKVTIQKAETAAAQPSVRREGFFCGAPVTHAPGPTAQSWSGASKKSLNFRPTQGLHPPIQQPIKPHDDSLPEVTIQAAAKPQNISPREIIPEAPKDFIPSRVAPDYVQPHPASNQPAPIQSRQNMDEILETCPSSDGCYWLPVATAAKLANIVTETKLTNGESRQIANKIEWFGYCFEPDARYGGGTYDIDQTLAVFKPFSGDQINPTTAYIGAANLLRLCVLISAADGQIDEVELEVYRKIIENQLDLTPTDHRRLQLLEKLLVLNPASGARTLAGVAKSIPAHKRLMIGKVLVQVAAADTVITKDERRALERIFKAFEIPQETLEILMLQACPPQQAGMVQAAPVSIPVKPDEPKESEDVLRRKKEWKEWDEAHRQWLALQERIAARPKKSPSEVSTDERIFIPQEARGRAISAFKISVRLGHIFGREQFFKLGDIHGISYTEFGKFSNCGKRTLEELRELVRMNQCSPQQFALDMVKVDSIRNETKEVVGILSVLMEDEPEKTNAATKTVAASALQVSDGGKSAPQPARFGGLNDAFVSILERLLTRDSWPQVDFNALAREFQFMPLNIRDTLNEWSDETLGDFILDGEDPVFVRRELMPKEKI